jgi:ABC-type transporter Mla subunit MlaD
VTAPASHFKLGLFAIAALGGVGIAAIGLGVHARGAPTVEYHAMFDESVQGLEVGAAVKYRGVPIGEVARVDVADDGTRVDARLAIDAAAASRLHLDTPPPGLRAELSSQGLTGVKFVDLDLLDAGEVAAEPAAELPPTVLPTRRSLATRLETEGDRLARELPQVLAAARATLRDVDGRVADVRGAHLVARVGALVDRADGAIDDVRGLVPRAAGAIASARRFGDDADRAVGEVRDAVAGFGSDGGAVASVRRAGDAVADLGHRTAAATDELHRTLHDLDDAARAVRNFIDELDRDPDMLVKGHAPARRP